MSHTIVTEMFLLTASVIIVTIVSAALFNNIIMLRDTQNIVTKNIEEKMSVNVEIIYAYGLDGENKVYIWIKNIGTNSIPNELVSKGDLYFGPSGNSTWIPYDSSTTSTWYYKFVNDVDGDNKWDYGETIEIIVTLNYTLSKGDYYIRYVTYTGGYTEYSFSIG